MDARTNSSVTQIGLSRYNSSKKPGAVARTLYSLGTRSVIRNEPSESEIAMPAGGPCEEGLAPVYAPTTAPGIGLPSSALVTLPLIVAVGISMMSSTSSPEATRTVSAVSCEPFLSYQKSAMLKSECERS
jgi:hypothetical protein